MSSIGHAASLRLTPKNRFHPIQTPTQTPTRISRDDSGLQLTLKNVIGTTTSSANAFDAVAEHHTFVCCAGPAAILSRVDEKLNIAQRLFRAKPNALPINATPSFYNPSTPPTTPGRGRQGSPLKEGIYGIGSTTSLEYSAETQGQSKAGNRSKESTCVSLSRCGKFLAVGETGYNPRVVLFSATSDNPSDTPLSALTDHSFGVTSVAFSSDSRWLCTLGNSYDGFVLIYSINQKTGLAKLHSSNKCSNVNSVLWMGSSVISIGTRHVKVWRVERAAPSSPSKTRLEIDINLSGPPGSPIPKTFSGRNCILGELIDSTFTALVAISDCRAIVCSAQGDICLLDDTDRTQRLEKVAQVAFKIHCVTFDCNNNIVWVAGEEGSMKAIRLHDLLKPRRSNPTSLVSSTLESESTSSFAKQPTTLAMGLVRNRIISVDSNRSIEIRTAEEISTIPASNTISKRLPAHDSAVLGVRSLLPKSSQDSPDFLTFSAKGSVRFWLLDGTCTGNVDIPLDQPNCSEDGDINELKTVIPSDADGHLLSGDKNGILRLVDRSSIEITTVQAHNGDINSLDITKTDDVTLVATCGRDRTLQLYRKDNIALSLLQTLDDHAAAVGDLKFFNGPSTLVSISSDRTVIVRKLASSENGSLAYITIRVVNLKASPVSFTSVPTEPNSIIVSTMDRQVQRYDISSGRLLHSFKASDPRNGDSVIMNSLVVHKCNEASGSRLLLGVSSTDKSLRVHDYDSGSLLTREYGQSAVSAIELIQEPIGNHLPHKSLISCGLDGTIMIWELSSHPRRNSGSDATSNGTNEVDSPPKTTTTPSQPLRRILSKAEISDFQKSLESDGDTVSPMSRAPSPSRIRRKTSRFSLAATPKLPAPTLPNGSNAPVLPSGRFDRRSSQEHSPIGPSANTKRPKRPSLSDRRRSKSTANLNDLNDSAEQQCKTLQTLRKRIASSATEKLNLGTAQELENELKLTLSVLSERNRTSYVGSETMAGDLLDVYLAKMIDERLALKEKSEEKVIAEPGMNVNRDDEQINTTAGAREGASELE